MAQRRILLIGNSHIQMIRNATGKGGKQDGIEVHWLKPSEKARYGEIGMDEAEAKIAALTASDLLLLTHLGTMHNMVGLLNHQRPFALARATAAGGTAAAEIIPEAAMAAHFRSVLDADRVVRRLARTAPCPVLHIMPPPPKRDLDHLLAEGKEYRGQAIAEYGFAPAPNRLALWQLEDELLTAWLAEQGLGTLPVPAEALTPEGYLHPDYAAPDATHANRAYGARLIDLARAALKEPA